ncbi:hypothetical protein [Glutamicibacter arilaitensis]|uniref:hypothetical protein n=1 Tax=Glutamicibacter arilaitensis TaxID=256701 RepID=UPI0011AEED39|nr:hypothetical protein [Glutamicibacter arilaitensis]
MSEDTTSTAHRITINALGAGTGGSAVPVVGGPIENTEAYVLERARCAGGRGRARRTVPGRRRTGARLRGTRR